MNPIGAATLLLPLLVLVSVRSGASQSATASGTNSSVTTEETTQAGTSTTRASETSPSPTTAMATSSSNTNSSQTTQSTTPLNTTSVHHSTSVPVHPSTTSPAFSNETRQASTGKVNITEFSINTTRNATLQPKHLTSSPPPANGTEKSSSDTIPKPEPTTRPFDHSAARWPPGDSELSTKPTPSALRYIAPAVMVPILLVGALSFIVWKMSQTTPAGGDQNATPRYVSNTGSVKLLSVRTTTPQTEVK